jgi:hypothetical protein
MKSKIYQKAKWFFSNRKILEADPLNLLVIRRASCHTGQAIQKI